MPQTSAPVRDTLQATMPALTPAERLVAALLLKDYPMGGLHSITELAEAANVSSPTVVRLARKLGFEGFTGLQDALRTEISAQIKRPMSKLEEAAGAAPGHRLDRMAVAAAENLHGTLARIDRGDFDAAVTLLADPGRGVFIEGGRLTRSIADHLCRHLQIVRPGVRALGGSPGVWPQLLLDIGALSVVVLFDIRRYESDLLKLSRLARARGARVVLFTDQWGSPIAADADHVFPALVETPSSWDSALAMLLVVEALVAEVQARTGGAARDRIEALEGMFTATRTFRDFNRGPRD